MLLFVTIELGFFISMAPRASKLKGLIDGYLVNLELWNALYIVNVCCFNTIFWNNTSPFWGKDSLTTFKQHLRHTENYLDTNVANSVKHDLGNYSTIYTDTFTKVKKITKINF